jgi:glucokinase
MASRAKARQSTGQQVFLAADIGGTHARVGLVSRRQDQNGPVTVLQYQRYACAEWPSLTAVLQNFVGSLDQSLNLDQCAVASAGYVRDDAIVNGNLPWPVSISDIRNSLGIARLRVINDFEAVAYASQFLGQADTKPVIESSAPAVPGPVLVMGPGTGLGSAVLLPGHPRASVLATEAGQIALAPGNEREIEILRVLAREHAHVSFEHALSGPGLLNLYRVLSQLRTGKSASGTPLRLGSPEAVTREALAGSDAVAVEALDVFCGLLGSFVGDLALLYGASGGIYLAGGILPQIHQTLLASTFAERFFNKGVMRAFLQQVPVRLMEHGQLGVIGAAGLFLDKQTPEEQAMYGSAQG